MCYAHIGVPIDGFRHVGRFANDSKQLAYIQTWSYTHTNTHFELWLTGSKMKRAHFVYASHWHCCCCCCCRCHCGRRHCRMERKKSVYVIQMQIFFCFSIACFIGMNIYIYICIVESLYLCAVAQSFWFLSIWRFWTTFISVFLFRSGPKDCPRVAERKTGRGKRDREWEGTGAVDERDECFHYALIRYGL